jgi:uracil phosphoribosyltransferase
MGSEITIVDHPLLKRDLTILRSKDTPPGLFRKTLSDAAAIMAYESMRHLAVREVEIETPLESTMGCVIEEDVVVVPILRAGLGMVDGFVRYVPEARIGHLGMYRDEKTFQPVDYYSSIPEGLNSTHTFVVDPMLATGGSGVGAITHLKAKGGTRFTFVCLVASPEGVKTLLAQHPDVRILTAAMDRELDENAYIRPGLGDAGDRIFGTL